MGGHVEGMWVGRTQWCYSAGSLEPVLNLEPAATKIMLLAKTSGTNRLLSLKNRLQIRFL